MYDMDRDDSPANSHISQSAELKGIFTIDKSSYDVVQKADCISWSCMSRAQKGRYFI